MQHQHCTPPVGRRSQPGGGCKAWELPVPHARWGSASPGKSPGLVRSSAWLAGIRSGEANRLGLLQLRALAADQSAQQATQQSNTRSKSAAKSAANLTGQSQQRGKRSSSKGERSIGVQASAQRSATKTAAAPPVLAAAPPLLQQYEQFDAIWTSLARQLELGKKVISTVSFLVRKGQLPCDATLLHARARAFFELGPAPVQPAPSPSPSLRGYLLAATASVCSIGPRPANLSGPDTGLASAPTSTSGSALQSQHAHAFEAGIGASVGPGLSLGSLRTAAAVPEAAPTPVTAPLRPRLLLAEHPGAVLRLPSLQLKSAVRRLLRLLPDVDPNLLVGTVVAELPCLPPELLAMKFLELSRVYRTVFGSSVPPRVFSYLVADPQEQRRRRRRRQQQLLEQRQLWQPPPQTDARASRSATAAAAATAATTAALGKSAPTAPATPPGGAVDEGRAAVAEASSSLMGPASQRRLPALVAATPRDLAAAAEVDSAALAPLQLQERLASLGQALGKEVAYVVLQNHPQLLDLDPALIAARCAALSQLLAPTAADNPTPTQQGTNTQVDDGWQARASRHASDERQRQAIGVSPRQRPQQQQQQEQRQAHWNEGELLEDDDVPHPEIDGGMAALWQVVERRGEVLLVATEQLEANMDALSHGLGWSRNRVRSLAVSEPLAVLSDWREVAGRWGQLESAVLLGAAVAGRQAWQQECCQAPVALLGLLLRRTVEVLDRLDYLLQNPRERRDDSLARILSETKADFVRRSPGYRRWRLQDPDTAMPVLPLLNLEPTEEVGSRSSQIARKDKGGKRQREEEAVTQALSSWWEDGGAQRVGEDDVEVLTSARDWGRSRLEAGADVSDDESSSSDHHNIVSTTVDARHQQQPWRGAEGLDPQPDVQGSVSPAGGGGGNNNSTEAGHRPASNHRGSSASREDGTSKAGLVASDGGSGRIDDASRAIGSNSSTSLQHDPRQLGGTTGKDSQRSSSVDTAYTAEAATMDKAGLQGAVRTQGVARAESMDNVVQAAKGGEMTMGGGGGAKSSSDGDVRQMVQPGAALHVASNGGGRQQATNSSARQDNGDGYRAPIRPATSDGGGTVSIAATRASDRRQNNAASGVANDTVELWKVSDQRGGRAGSGLPDRQHGVAGATVRGSTGRSNGDGAGSSAGSRLLTKTSGSTRDSKGGGSAGAGSKAAPGGKRSPQGKGPVDTAARQAAAAAAARAAALHTAALLLASPPQSRDGNARGGGSEKGGRAPHGLSSADDLDGDQGLVLLDD